MIELSLELIADEFSNVNVVATKKLKNWMVKNWLVRSNAEQIT